MKMLKELLEQGFGKDLDSNCAEKIVYGANLAYDLNLSPEAMKLSAGFGGGMGVESECGTISGAVMVLSHLYVKHNAHESVRIKELTSEFFDDFEKDMGYTDCFNLKAKYMQDNAKCDVIIFRAAAILDRIVAREGME